MTQVFIGLGSNLGNPEYQIQKALEVITTLPKSQLIQTSSLYRTAPVGFKDQPDFVNAVCEVETQLSSLSLLEALMNIELSQNRIRTDTKNGPRTLDLDILLYGNHVITEKNLTLPHPRLIERAFTLLPLYEIAPDHVLPDGKTLADLVKMEEIIAQEIQRIYFLLK